MGLAIRGSRAELDVPKRKGRCDALRRAPAQREGLGCVPTRVTPGPTSSIRPKVRAVLSRSAPTRSGDTNGRFCVGRACFRARCRCARATATHCRQRGFAKQRTPAPSPKVDAGEREEAVVVAPAAGFAVLWSQNWGFTRLGFRDIAAVGRSYPRICLPDPSSRPCKCVSPIGHNPEKGIEPLADEPGRTE